MATSESELRADLSPIERLVLDTIQASSQPVDAIDIASVTRLDVDDVLTAVMVLLDANLVARATPEPVHERFATAAA